MPQDIIDSLKQIAPLRGFTGYQALLKSYVGDGLRADEALISQSNLGTRLANRFKGLGSDDFTIAERTNTQKDL